MAPLTLQYDMRDVYPGAHWAIRGEAPAFDTPDEDVYLEGRNIVRVATREQFEQSWRPAEFPAGAGLDHAGADDGRGAVRQAEPAAQLGGFLCVPGFDAIPDRPRRGVEQLRDIAGLQQAECP